MEVLVMDENYCNLLEKKVDSLEKELLELKQEHHSLEKAHSGFVIFVIILLLVAIYLLLAYGVDMYHSYSQFKDFEQSFSQMMSSFSWQ